PAGPRARGRPPWPARSTGGKMVPALAPHAGPGARDACRPPVAGRYHAAAPPPGCPPGTYPPLARPSPGMTPRVRHIPYTSRLSARVASPHLLNGDGEG